jgi:hypothetical protein
VCLLFGSESAQKWVAAALKEAGDNPSKVKYLIPPGTKVPKAIQEFLDLKGIKIIDDIPHR